MAARQLRLLLWKDYLIRKRKVITLAGIIWATAVMLSLYIVRVNVDNIDFPTCQFPARALPSAGMLTFLQSFICGVNNECSPMDQFDEIPTYENSKLTQLQRQFAPLLFNETVIDVAGTFPDALKLLAKLSDIVDEPVFVDITKNGLKVNDLFNNPTRVKRYLSSHLKITDDVAYSVMTSDLSFQGIFKGSVDRCSAESISGTIVINNSEHLEILVKKLCSLSDKDVQNIFMDLMLEVNFNKFIKMIGNMYTKLSGDDRISKLGATLTAVMRMSRLQSFLPAELVAILPGDVGFSYFDLKLIPKVMDLFKPTFGDTESYKSIREFADTAVVGVTYLSRFIVKQTNSTETQDEPKDINVVNKIFSDAVAVVEEATAGDDASDVFNVLTQVTKLIYKWLPDNLKHDVLFYSTLLSKLIEGADKVIRINKHIEEKAYEVSLRHPKGVEILVGLSGAIVGKGFEALTDAERTQIMTAKINNPGQMFCDLNRLQGFFKISKEEATSLRSLLCTNEWKDYVTDLIKTFGIYEVKDNINTMASLVIQETLGKDASDQFYTIDYDFQVLKNFTQSLKTINDEVPHKDWKKLFNVTDDSEFMKTIRDKGRLGKQMLVVIHGALAKMVVTQNPILSYKISPAFIDTTTLVTAINKQIGATEKTLVDRVKKMYPDILLTVLETALDDKKSYKALSTYSVDIMCNGVDNASLYLVIPDSVDKDELVATLCDISMAIEEGLAKDSEFGKAIETIRSTKRGSFEEVKWTELITGLKDLYTKLERDYPYLLEYSSYNMNEDRRSATEKKFEEAKGMWFSSKSIGRSLHLSVKLVFRLLDLMDRDIFNITDEFWLKMKYGFSAITGPAAVFDDFVKLVTAISRNESYSSDFPATTASALRVIIPNAPQLIMDTAENIINDNTELEPIISLLNSDPPWPCSNSLTGLVDLSPGSSAAVQALETLGCDRGLREEWRKHLEMRNVTVFNPRLWNTTTYSPHLFLKFSSVFDSMLDDAHLLKEVVELLSTEDSERVTWADAWRRIEELWGRDDRDAVLRSFFTKLDLVLNSINTTSTPGSLQTVWSGYIQCTGENCNDKGRTTLKYTLEFLSVIFQNIAEDLEKYFRESNEPNSSILQLLGFTRGTALYDMYDRIPDFIGVLLNSYFDYGFMSQIRRASNSQFWDCEALVFSLSPPPGSRITVSDIKRIKPFICPSFLYWISFPRGDNTLLDVVAKPQYYFYTVEAHKLTSNYSGAFEKITKLAKLVTDIVNTNKTVLDEKEIKINTVKEKLENLVDTVLKYEINKTDNGYLHFSEVNQKQFASTAYLTRIVAIINKIASEIENLKISDFKTDEETANKLESELISIQKIFKRRPSDIVAVHFDVITDLVWTNSENYTLVKAFETACNNLKNNDTSKDLVIENQRVKNQICTKNYKIIYEAIENKFNDDYDKARNSLIRLLEILKNGNNDDVTNVFEFLNQRKQLTNSTRASIKYAYDLSIPIYLQYLQSNLQHYDVIISFLNGDDWWSALRQLYRGKYATSFFDSLEKGFEITESVLRNLDEIHLVRLLRDINVNNSDAFCGPSITLSDYLPDATAALSTLHRQLCDANRSLLFTELPQLVFASQGYDSSLKLSKEMNYTDLYSDISKVENHLDQISEPQTPRRPQWVTEERLSKLREVALGLLSKDTLTRVSFGFLSNFVDAGTLFLNNSRCTLCSEFTTWFKQLNLQVFKKQEYDNLLCHMHEMSLDEVHYTLKNNFHWDMAIRELISTRNYTKLELNKSINEFLEVVKLHLLEDIQAPNTKLSECLAHNVSRNGFGNATLFVSILSHTARLLRSEAPHLSEIEGITSLPYLRQLAADVAHNLNVFVPLKRYLNKGNEEMDVVKGGVMNLRLARNLQLSDVKIPNNNWDDICKESDCSKILEDINKSLNWTLIDQDLPTLQNQQFWRLSFVANILEHTEHLLGHVGRLLGVASRVDLRGVGDGELVALIDFLMQVLMEVSLNGIVYSLQGIVEELHPLLQNTTLEYDLTALSTGLQVVQQFKNYILEKEDLNVEVSSYFSPEHVEAGLSALGINNTNFWSIAAPRVHAGHLQLKPLFAKQDEYHISSFVCQMESMSKVIVPANLDVVTAEDVHAAIIEQFCGLSDERAKEIVPVLLENMNFSAILDRIKTTLLTQLYAASNLTEAEGATVLEMYPRMAALLPVIQESVGDLSETIAQEPLIQSLKGADSIGGLLGSPEFLSSAGQMLCGKPFQTDQNRFYAAIAKSPDFSNEPDQAQLDVLPTDFCRSLYKDIVNMDGGKIVWSFVKPLIMGKILYTPLNPAVQTIIEKANSTFSHMIKLTSLIHSFSSSFSTIHVLSEHREGVGALRSIMTAPAFTELRSLLVGGDVAVDVDVDVDGLFDEFGDLESIGSLLKKGSDLLHCINMNRFQAVPDEYQLTHEAAKLSRVNEFSAGIVFLNTGEQAGKPTNVEYKIRMDIENAPTTSRKKNYLWIPGPESSFIEHMRYFRGFIQIQDIIDRAVIELSRSNTRQKRETTMDEWTVYTQQEPYPCYKKDFFQTSLYESQALIVAFLFSLLFTVSSIVRFIVADKESGNTMLMSVMGVNLNNHTLSWFIASAVEMLVTCGCIAAVLKLGGILPHTAPTLLLLLLFVFGVSVLAFCYMMSKLFSSASYAAVCTGIAYLCTFMPFVIILSLEAVMTSTLKLFVCLSMSSAICYSFLFVTRLEAMGAGAAWSDLWLAPDAGDMTIGAGALMALADAAIYVVIGYLLDRYFGLKTQQSNITNCTTANEKAGVSIVNITKVYGEGTRRAKVALDNVSIELHKGQITTLLGHNGAGKTTLTNILTGMLKPTKGHVIIRSDTSAHTRTGVCPQRDVLIDCLSAREHIALYAQLKSGKSYEEVRDEVESMLEVLSLGAVSRQRVCRLSGGTRRRLCVALAFVARPALVSLDEPTAGVDPTARRDIWSMIEKLRADRTILLTTHHLDEAELLSDQIVIMHKGQIHTVGSPIEIKRSLGSGYKLSVTFPNKPQEWSDDGDSIEEKTKQLLAVVREDVKNASLVDVNGAEVEVTLPFFDANGLNNNYLQLCTQLEARQSELGFRSYNMDCSSLEQVFFNICQQADAPHHGIELDPDAPSHSASTSSIKNDKAPLVSAEGPLKGSPCQQFLALLHARYLHYIRNRGLLFLLIVLPTIFVVTAMGFSMIRPPADSEISLRLHPDIYEGSTRYLVPRPSIYSDSIDPSFAERVMSLLSYGDDTRNWTSEDTPDCKCTESRQVCEVNKQHNPSRLMVLPDVERLNQWIVSTQDLFMETRYGGFTSTLKNNVTNLVAWYNNKGHHAMPAYLNALNNALLKTVSGDQSANITVYSHPLKISKEQISKDTVYQHIADAGISALVLIAYSLVSGGAAIYLVSARRSQEKRLQLLCGVSPALYWAAALAADMAIIVINMVITVIVFEAFGFPVFVARNNLPAICLLILLYGYACGSFVHVCEKLFSEASLANMLLFCGNAFLGLIGITLLVILDIISDSDETDHARWVLHKVLMLSPQFVLGDGLLEIAKNTIQAQVLHRFGMDTYKDPLSSDLIVYHYVSLVLVGTVLLLLNLAIEYGCFEGLLDRFQSEPKEKLEGEMEDMEVAAERQRVHAAIARAAEGPLRLQTIGNINAGFVDTEVDKNSIKRIVSTAKDVAQCVALRKSYSAVPRRRVAVRDLTLGIPAGQCTALLGQNGAGKSTTFSMLTGEVRPSSGTVYLNDSLADSRQLCRGLISYCPQSDAIDPLMTVRETLAFFCRLRGITDQNEVIKRTLDMFDLGKYADVRNGTLSGGNKRKLCTAVAFMGRTPLVLLDEPTSGMDPVSRACVSRGAMASLACRRGVLLSTHALEDARRLAARVAIMRGGLLCALASLDDCLRRFGGGYVVACRCRGAPRAVWGRVSRAAPHARLSVLHHAALHFLLPARATLDKKEIETNLSDVFRLMAELMSTCDIEDFTVNQSSLDQMFLSFTERSSSLDPVDLEPLPSPARDDELNSITSL